MKQAILLSVVYWFAALFLLGFVLVVFGDCFTDTRPNGPELCFAEQSIIRNVGLAAAAIVYLIGGIVIWRRRS
jgi:uncharacterized membrane protein